MPAVVSAVRRDKWPIPPAAVVPSSLLVDGHLLH
jgi:hypothetical protein